MIKMQTHLGIIGLEANILVTNPALGEISWQLGESRNWTLKLCLKADFDSEMAEYKWPVS